MSDHGHGHVHDPQDPACARAHGDLPPLTGDRRLVAVFVSPVASALVQLAPLLGFEVALLDPAPPADHDGAGAQDDVPLFRRAAEAALDVRTDVVVCDHDRPELGEVLADVLTHEARWVGVMGSLRHTAPHVAALRDLGVSEQDIARVHRPIGLDIGAQSPAEIAVSTLAGLVADRNGRSGGPFTPSGQDVVATVG